MNKNEIILTVISIGFLGLGLLAFEKNIRLKRDGKKAKAIIFKNNYKTSPDKNGGSYYPVVRFVTENNYWITQELNFGLSSPMREGKEIEVFYDPNNPQEVVVNSNLQLKFIPWLFTFTGSCGLIICFLELLDITNLI